MAGERPKKRRRPNNGVADHGAVNTSKPTAVFTPTGNPRKHTLSVALPGSFLNNAHSFDLKNTLAGQIGRALAVFCVDEVVIFDDGVKDGHPSTQQRYQNQETSTSPNDLLALILSYLETPPHMRRKLFPMNPDLQKAGLLPSLDMPHHLRRDEWCQYREGVTVEDDSLGSSTTVDIGTGQAVKLTEEIPPNTRVTIKFSSSKPESSPQAQAVAPSAPREEAGWYWGYDVRRADSLSAVFTECPWEGGYDTSIGTSERGRVVQDLLKLCSEADNARGKTKIENGVSQERSKVEALRNYSHLLVVFGGHQGLEVAARNDQELGKLGTDQPEELFDWWINLCPEQGSRTIRTEEAIWLGLMALNAIVIERNERS